MRFVRSRKIRNFREIENEKISQIKEKFREKIRKFHEKMRKFRNKTIRKFHEKIRRKLNFLVIGWLIITVEHMYCGRTDRNIKQIASEIKVKSKSLYQTFIYKYIYI